VKKKILCILQLAPPVHGASMANGYLTKSPLINNHFALEIINLQFAASVQELKKFTIRKLFKALGYAFTILKKMFQFRPDLVHFTLSTMGFAFYRDAFYVAIIKCFSPAIVYHLHTKGIKKNTEGHFLKKRICRFVFKNTESICLSTNLTKDIEQVSVSIPYIVPYGIPVSRPAENGTAARSGSIPQILYLGNYIESKGVLVLVEALSLLAERGHVFSARLVGAPADVTMEMLERKIGEKNLTASVTATGPLYNERKLEEYRNADIFVFPTFYENEAFPLVLLEALQYGLPIVSTFEGGIPEMIIDNETGLLVESQNAEMLAGKISALLTDPARRKEMGRRGYQRFKNNYTLEHFENNMLRTFNAILKIS
jgi:glycosyltransferase involved in cell wall biosynthesis